MAISPASSSFVQGPLPGWPVPAPAPAPVAGEGDAQDPQQKRKEAAKKALDATGQATGAAGVAQDSTRWASLIHKTGVGAKGLQAVAGVVNGDPESVDAAVKAGSRVSAMAPYLRASGAFLKASGKYLQVVSLPFAAKDVYDAVKAKPADKDAAIANASLSVSGGVAGAAGAFLFATPIGIPLLATSALTGGFQLIDNFVWHGKGTDFLGQHVVKPVKDLFQQLF